MNTRVKLLRTSIGLNQEKFGERLGVTKASISKIEAGVNNLTDSMIKLICNEFNANDHWLRTGEGEMFEKPASFSLDDYAKKHQLTTLELEIMKGYMELSKEVRQELMAFAQAKFAQYGEISATTASVEPTPEQIAKEEAEKYRLEVLAELKGKTSLASDERGEKLG